jgi:hypothetical protein
MTLVRGKSARIKNKATSQTQPGAKMNYSDLNSLIDVSQAPGNPYKSTFDNTNTPEAKMAQAVAKATRSGKPVKFGALRFK